jgi:hypothetical protein
MKMRVNHARVLVTFVLLAAVPFTGAPGAEPKKGSSKIVPGKAVVPTDAMRRIWGELISVDLKTRTGTFRNESNDEVLSFTVLPYAELLHHAAFGDLQDFRIGERAIFRLHQNDEGKWVWLTYIQDEMNFLAGHKEYYWVDRIDADRGQIEYTQANADKSYVRAKGLILETDDQIRYWKNGERVKFSDIRVGDKLRAKSHGIGKGKHHRCWEVFLDDASLEKFQKEQQAIHHKRLLEDGWPGYVDEVGPKEARLTLFLEGRELARSLKVGEAVRLAPAGADRKAGKAIEGTIKEHRAVGALQAVKISLKEPPPETLVATGVARLWLPGIDK